jgi:hypothetical protein
MSWAIARRGKILALTKDVARLGSYDVGGGGSRRGRRRRRTLDAGVHVTLVVVTDEEHVVVAFEHPRETAKANVYRAAITGLGDHAHARATLHPQRRGDAGRDRGGVTKERVQPRNLPRRLWIRSGKDLKTTRRVHRDDLTLRRAHRRVERVTGAERLAAALARAMARVD